MNKSCLLLMLLSAAFFPASAQKDAKTQSELAKTNRQINEKTITGEVMDENGDPVIGATVMLEGTSIGTATDIDGQFAILSNQKSPVLKISYVGMKTVEIAPGHDFRFLKIKMEPETMMMETVVVTGYQNIKRENATGAYQVIKASDLDKRTLGDLSDNLEGCIPGLVKNTSSDSKDEDVFTVRGVGTFQAATKPLVVVDGLPIEGGMSTVNPYDIENITLLKDAAAASIYGARAANGVLVITTKRAKSEKLTVDFNADLTIREKQDYSNFKWANAAQLIELEQYNWNAMLAQDSQRDLQSLYTAYQSGRIESVSPVTRLLFNNMMGLVSDEEKDATLAKWARNDYRKEWCNVHNRTQVMQNYNLSLRTQGKIVNSSINANYSYDNTGVRKEHSDELTLKYRGEIKASRWLDLTVGLNVLNRRSKTHEFGMTSFAGINSYLPYQSMYDETGNPALMEGEVLPTYSAFDNPQFELKSPCFNLHDEMNRNFRNYRYTNIRSYANALFKLLPGWTANAQFQYEDIFSTSSTLNEAESYYTRTLYNGYTTGGNITEYEETDIDFFTAFLDPTFDWTDYAYTDAQGNWFMDDNMNILVKKKVNRALPTVHHIPDGGIYRTSTTQGQFYTFRSQTNYNRLFAQKHEIDVLGGFEFRQTHQRGKNEIFYGYDHATQSNLNLLTDWAFINTPVTGVLADHYAQGFAPSDFSTSDVLHRFYSIYFNANYIYDNRYGISGSYRIDKCDLFGTDPKFRGRPLWSVGGTWNAHNEAFMHTFTWINALKVRASYGLTGNIDSSVSSYLVAKMSTNQFTGDRQGTLKSPPNDQLRWEKTSTWNAGVDFSFLNFRLNGSVDFYRKSGSDILTVTDLDRTTGWSSLTINSGKVRNTGIELQLDARILQQKQRNDLGVNLGFNMAWNDNKVVKISHYANSGYGYLTANLHEGYPLNSIFSFDYTGIVEKEGMYYMGWRDNEGNIQTSNVQTADFKIEDAVYSGSATPKVTGSLTPEILWNGFSLSAMMAFYGGHYMRAGNDDWYTGGSSCGYSVVWGMGGDVPASALNYWKGDTSVPANGIDYHSKYNYMSMAGYRSSNVVHADYMKVRNIVLSYNLAPRVCARMGFSNIRLRFQMNNIATWTRNGLGVDPEAMSGGYHTYKTPRSYTIGLYFSL